MSNKPIWIWVDEKLPECGDVVKATDGYYVSDAHVTLKGEWSYIHDDAGPVIAWLYVPTNMQPPPPTIGDYEEYQMQLDEQYKDMRKEEIRRFELRQLEEQR